jgi:hypothetical protein
LVEGPTFPAASTARTLREWLPSGRDDKVRVLVVEEVDVSRLELLGEALLRVVAG